VSGAVVLLRPPGYEPPSEHEAATQAAVVRMLAELKGYKFAGVHDRGRRYPGRVFFVPPDVLIADEAAALGITSADDLFGGVVPRRPARRLRPAGGRAHGRSPAHRRRRRQLRRLSGDPAGRRAA